METRIELRQAVLGPPIAHEHPLRAAPLLLDVVWLAVDMHLWAKAEAQRFFEF